MFSLLAVFLERGDFIGFTFLLTTLAMLAASVFFLFERSQVAPQWRTSLLVAALVTLIAGTNYVFMSTVWITTHTPAIELRYLDWFLTVPLICLQFYLLLESAGARPGRGMLWRLVGASVWMLAFGYVGQMVDPTQTLLWGGVSSIGYAATLFEMSLGEASQLSVLEENARVKNTYDLLFRFIFIGWAIYPLGYMTMPGNLLSRWSSVLPFPAIYNFGDAVNKIGFGLVIWNLARSSAVEPIIQAQVVGLPRPATFGK